MSTIRGGASGYPAVIPGRSAQSYLIQVVSDQVDGSEMPPPRQRRRFPALTPEEVRLLCAWIDQGAR